MDAILNRYASVQTHDIHAGNETWLRIFWIMDVMHIEFALPVSDMPL